MWRRQGRDGACRRERKGAGRSRSGSVINGKKLKKRDQPGQGHSVQEGHGKEVGIHWESGRDGEARRRIMVALAMAWPRRAELWQKQCWRYWARAQYGLTIQSKPCWTKQLSMNHHADSVHNVQGHIRRGLLEGQVTQIWARNRKQQKKENSSQEAHKRGNAWRIKGAMLGALFFLE